MDFMAVSSYGNRTKVKVVKNKVSPPFKTAEFDIVYGKGISKIGEIIDLGVALGIIDKSGAFYSYNGERLGQGKEKVKTFMEEHPEITNEIEEKIRNAGVEAEIEMDEDPLDSADFDIDIV